VALAHGSLTPSGSIGALMISTTYRATQDKLVACEAPPRLPTDPPDLSRETLWAGTSVTAAGDVYGPTSAPFQRLVSLTVGSVSTRLLVSGERRWVPGPAGELQASAPAPFERLALSFTRAFGGHVDVPPGLFPGSDLPFPGGRLAYPSNGIGIGFYLDSASAAGRPLPSFELAEQAVRQWSDRPVPGCFVPCPELPGLRADRIAQWDPRTTEGMIKHAVRIRHHAPGYLVFDAVPPGTTIRLDGVGRETIRFEVPPPPGRVRIRRSARFDETRVELRSVHLDADRGVVSFIHGYSFLYQEADAPSWVLVEA
jgi:hypothetical protein